MNIQIIEHNGIPEYAIVPFSEWQAIMDRMEELEDIHDALLKEGVRGKYAKRYEHGTNLVLLSPDVARYFASDEAVNEALRLFIQLKKIPCGGKRRSAVIRQKPIVDIKEERANHHIG